MIESGTHTPGVSVAEWRLPPHTALRFELPAPELRGCVADYHVLDSEGPEAEGAVSWLLPAWPAIRVILTDRPIRLTVGNRRYDPLPTASLYGTTSRVMEMVSNGGVTVGVGLRPAGWARLFGEGADRFRDRVVPLAELMDPVLVCDLVERLRASDQGPAVKGILDGFLAAALGPPHPEEERIARLSALVADEEVADLVTASERAGIGADALRRLSVRYFGFPPKTLFIRTRFLRSLVRMMAAGPDADYSKVGAGYHDASHFLRDADRFLGMTPRRFLRHYENPYPRAVLRARMLVAEAARRVGG